MDAVVRAAAFLLIAIGTPWFRASIGALESGEQISISAFDFALDADMGALGVIVGVGFYILAGATLTKPGPPPITITMTDAWDCAFVVGALGFLPTILLPLWFGHFGLKLQGGNEVFWVLLIPDGLSAGALVFTVAKLT